MFLSMLLVITMLDLAALALKRVDPNFDVPCNCYMEKDLKKLTFRWFHVKDLFL